jgi:hypothetical protein
MLAQRDLPRKSYANSDSGQKPVSSDKSSGTRCQSDIETFESTFPHQADFHQHEIPIRGLKQLCPFDTCGYATGKVGKMMEHIRNMHEAEGKYTLSLHQ